MKAAFRSKYGLPEVLTIQEVTTPTPKDKELLIRVHAATANRTDCGILFAQPFIMRFFTGLFRPRSHGIGTDFAGQVEAIGKDVSNFKVGDRVWGFDETLKGTHAHYITRPESSRILVIPDSISYEDAAASVEGAHYAHNCIKRVRLKQGDPVLVYGATGAIGSAAVQLLKYFGANLTAVCNTKNIELVRSLGADRIIDFQLEDFTKDTQKYHFVFDAVGKCTFSQCKPLLMPGGFYISSDLGPGIQNMYLPMTTRFSNKRVIFPMPTGMIDSLRLMKSLLESKQFKPVIDRRYPMEEIVEAFKYVASGQKTGNVILTFEG